MAAPAQEWQWPSSWTEADLRHLPDDGHRYEVFDGSLLVTPPAGETHQGISLSLAMVLHATAPSGWRVLQEIGLRCGGRLLIPDLVVLPPHAPRAEADYNDTHKVPPALVVEIESRSTVLMDRGSRPMAYSEASIPVYWRVERDGTVHIHQQPDDGEPYKLLHTVRTGSTFQVDVPFPMLLDPAAIASR